MPDRDKFNIRHCCVTGKECSLLIISLRSDRVCDRALRTKNTFSSWPVGRSWHGAGRSRSRGRHRPLPPCRKTPWPFPRHGLLLPGVDHSLVDAVLGGQMRYRLLPRSASRATFALNSAEYRFLFPVIGLVLPSGRTKLSSLSGFRGPPHYSSSATARCDKAKSCSSSATEGFVCRRLDHHRDGLRA